jgi:hypothetical protein
MKHGLTRHLRRACRKLNPSFWADGITYIGAMTALLWFLLAVLVAPLRSNSSLLAENALLRHQVKVLRRKTKGRVSLTNGDRWFFVQLFRCRTYGSKP